MYIFIEAVTGLTIRMEVDENDFIRSVKERLMICEDIPVEDQNLIFLNTNLSDSKRLKEYQIKSGAILKLVLQMRGGPISPDVIYDDDLFSSCDISDKMVFLFLENGDITYMPLSSMDLQKGKNLAEGAVNLANNDMYSSIPTHEQDSKMTILRLKMDNIRLNKRISSMFSSQNSNSVKSSNNYLKNNSKELINPILQTSKSKELNYQTPNSTKTPAVLHRSISLDSRSTGIIPGLSDMLKNIKPVPLNNRSPRLGLHRTMSVLDTMRVNKVYSTFPHLKEIEKNKEALKNYADSFNYSLNRNISKESNLKTLPPLNESEFENKRNSSRKPRCNICNKKLTIVLEFTCRCSGKFCSQHRYPEEHFCTYDYKTNGQLELIKNNPIIRAEKISKI